MQATQPQTQQSEQPQARQNTMVNGVDVPALAATIKAVRQDPSLAAFQFRADNRWMGGGLNRSTIGAFHGTRQEHARRQPFVYTNDEPPVLLGEDRGANPVEYILHAMAGCMSTSMAYHAAARGVQIESMESHVEGEIDLNGLLQTDPSVRSGYQQIRITFRVKTPGDAEMLKRLCQLSPVFDTIRNPVDVRVDVQTR